MSKSENIYAMQMILCSPSCQDDYIVYDPKLYRNVDNCVNDFVKKLKELIEDELDVYDTNCLDGDEYFVKGRIDFINEWNDINIFQLAEKLKKDRKITIEFDGLTDKSCTFKIYKCKIH